METGRYKKDEHLLTSSCHRRQETQRLIAEPVAGISATPYQDNLRYFAVAIEGPEDSPYERGVFQLELFLPADYPMAPPKVRFLTKLFHPNIDKLGTSRAANGMEFICVKKSANVAHADFFSFFLSTQN